MEIKKVKFNDYAKEALDQLSKGVFLTTKNNDTVNTMTIGWGSIGRIWNKPIFTVLVRYSRHTYTILEKSKEFTVSIPLNNDLKKELVYCGSNSGRDVDKFKEANLTLLDGQKISTPVVSDCELYYECKVVYQQSMEPATLDNGIKEKQYSDNDYHVLYFGEIVDSYIIEK